MEQVTLGERLTQARKAKGWSQQQLAAAVGVRQGTVSDWESDTSEPRYSDLVKLEAAIGGPLRPERPSDYFERGMAVGEFRALAAMAAAIAERAAGAADRLVTPPGVPASARAAGRKALETAVTTTPKSRGGRR